MCYIYYFENNDTFALRGEINKAVTIELMLATGHPSDCFWCKRDFGRKFLVAALCWLLAGLWHWPFFAVLRANPSFSLNSGKGYQNIRTAALEIFHNNATKIL